MMISPFDMQTVHFDLKELPEVNFKTGEETIPLLPVIASFCRCKVSDIISKDRTRNIVYGRHIARFLYHKIFSNTMLMLRKGFGDHATTLHSIRTVENLIDTDKSFRQLYFQIEMEFIYLVNEYEKHLILSRKPRVLYRTIHQVPSSFRPIHFRIAKTINGHCRMYKGRSFTKEMEMAKNRRNKFIEKLREIRTYNKTIRA